MISSSFLGSLQPSDHCISFYRTPEEKRATLFNFLKAGLDRGEGAVYVAGDEAPEVILKAMLDYGLDVRGLEKEGLLNVIDYDGWYIVDGKVEIAGIIALWARTYERALETGLKGLHACGEMGCFFRHKVVAELVEYEKALGRKLKIPMAALCSYSLNHIRLLEGGPFCELVKCHSHVLSPSFAGTVEFEDLYPRVLVEELEAMFGRGAARTILTFMKRWLSASEAEFFDKPKNFFTALHSLFGSGSDLIEKRILKGLCKRLGLNSKVL